MFKVGETVVQKRTGYVGTVTAVSRNGLDIVVDFDATFGRGMSVVKVRAGGLRRV